jgi:hypothetical protein
MDKSDKIGVIVCAVTVAINVYAIIAVVVAGGIALTGNVIWPSSDEEAIITSLMILAGVKPFDIIAIFAAIRQVAWGIVAGGSVVGGVFMLFHLFRRKET